MGRFDESFQGTIALVTGGASGIGRATCQRLAHEGARVVVADLDAAGAKSVAEAIGGEAMTLDVADPGAWTDAVDGIVSRHGGLHLAYLNAGIMTFRGNPKALEGGFDLGAMTDAQYRSIMGANVDGVVLGTRACAPAIAGSGGGALVATASVAGVASFPPDPVYTATKHAVVGFVRAMSPILAPQGVAFHAVLPGIVDTNIVAGDFGEQARARGMSVMEPSEIAEGVVHAVRTPETGGLWLCLPDREPHLYAFNPVVGVGGPSVIEEPGS